MMDLIEFIGKQVTIWVGNSIKNSFDTQISVSGILEKKEGTSSYRVLKDNSTYSYFTREDIIELGSYGEGKTFRGGSVAVIKIKIKL